MSERRYVYAIATPDIHLPTSVSGFGGPLQLIRCGELAAVASVVDAAYSDGDAPEPTMENLMRHETVVEAVCAAGLALPVRFGAVMADSDALMSALEKRYEPLRNALRRVGDKVEMGVTALWRNPETPADAGGSAKETSAERSAGVAYLRARQVAYRREESARARAQALAQELDVALRPLAIEWSRSLCPSDRLALRDQYLIARDQVSAFDQAFDEVRKRHQEARFLLSGPWPPYTFVTLPMR